MTAKAADIKARKDKILGITVMQYIKTVSPVSSAFIAKRYFRDLSSATIRNILAELEGEGYLTHPHISAGRVPTQKGYRYYVDHLIEEIQLLSAEKERIKVEYDKASMELEELLDKVSEEVSNLTQYTSIISLDGCKNKIFCRGTGHIITYVDDENLNKISRILMELERKERLLKLLNRELENKIDVFIGSEIQCDGIDSCSLVVSKYSTNKGASGRMAVLGPTRMDYERVISALDYFSELMGKIL
jgi:transcriptional regulator of heat shock response